MMMERERIQEGISRGWAVPFLLIAIAMAVMAVVTGSWWWTLWIVLLTGGYIWLTTRAAHRRRAG